MGTCCTDPAQDLVTAGEEPEGQSVDYLSVDDLSVDDISVDDPSVDDLSVGDLSVDDLSVDYISNVCIEGISDVCIDRIAMGAYIIDLAQNLIMAGEDVDLLVDDISVDDLSGNDLSVDDLSVRYVHGSQSETLQQSSYLRRSVRNGKNQTNH